MAFPGAEKLLDFSQALDVPMLDQVISAFYTAADPTMVRLAPRARRANRPPLPNPSNRPSPHAPAAIDVERPALGPPRRDRKDPRPRFLFPEPSFRDPRDEVLTRLFPSRSAPRPRRS